MLKHAGRVAHPFDRGQVGAERRDRDVAQRIALQPARMPGDHRGDQRHARLRQARPQHRAAARIGAPRDRVAPDRVGEQARDRARKCGAVAERDDHAMAIGQDFVGVDIGGGDHRLAHRDGIGQRARRDLRRIDIGRDVEVGGLEIIEQVVFLDKGVDELDVVGDPQPRSLRDQAVAIRLAFVRDQIGVGGAQHDIEHAGVRAHDFGQRRDHRLDPLAGREQAEGEDNRAVLPPETRLHHCGVDQRAVGHAMRDHGNPVGR